MGTSIQSLSYGALVKQDQVIIDLRFQTLPLDCSYLVLAPDLFTGSLSFLADFPASVFFLSLGDIMKLGEQLLPLQPRLDDGQKRWPPAAIESLTLLSFLCTFKMFFL